MCQCQKEMSRPARIAALVILLSLGIVFFGYIAMYHDDLFRPFREHGVQLRRKTMKVDGYTAVGPSISWRSSEGRDIPIEPRFLLGQERSSSSPDWRDSAREPTG